MKLALKSLSVVAAILLSFPEYRRRILRLRNTILAAPLSDFNVLQSQGQATNQKAKDQKRKLYGNQFTKPTSTISSTNNAPEDIKKPLQDEPTTSTAAGSVPQCSD